jgi:protein JSN1
VLTTPFFDDSIRNQVVENVKAVLLRIKAQGNSGYKRLMDEVGLSTRNGSGASRDHGSNAGDRQRPSSRHHGSNGQHHQQQHSHQQGQRFQEKQQSQPQVQGQGQFGTGNGQYYNPVTPVGNTSNFELGYGIPRSESVEPPLAQQFPAFGGQPGMYGGNSPAMQMHYQPNMMGRGGPPMNNFYAPGLQAGYGGYHTPSPSIDQYRSQNLVNGSPVQPPLNQMPPGPNAQGPYGAPSYGVPMGVNGFGYPGMNGMQQPNAPYMQEQGNNTGRRGRVGFNPHPARDQFKNARLTRTQQR